MSTRSRRRSRTPSRRMRCSRTTCSKGSMPASRWSPTWNWWTNTRRAFSPTPVVSTAGFAATGRSCCGCSRSSRHGHGLTRNTLPLIGRWKILDNLRRSLVAPTLLDAARRRLDRAAGAAGVLGRSRSLVVLASQLLPLVDAAAGRARQGAVVFGVLAQSSRRQCDRARAGRARRDLPRQQRVGNLYTPSSSRSCGSPSPGGACSSGKRRPRRRSGHSASLAAKGPGALRRR